MKSLRVHHKSVKTKRLRMQRFGDKIGTFLCRPYVANPNSPLATQTRHLRLEQKYTQQFVEENRDAALPTLSQLAVGHTALPAMENLSRDIEHNHFPPYSADDQAYIAWLVVKCQIPW